VLGGAGEVVGQVRGGELNRQPQNRRRLLDSLRQISHRTPDGDEELLKIRSCPPRFERRAEPVETILEKLSTGPTPVRNVCMQGVAIAQTPARPTNVRPQQRSWFDILQDLLLTL
jgi:hypothetical protein